jgi:8-oxo-dGTP pyrophosphatase MutT (NUDIX family)
MRESIAAIALITRQQDGQTLWLARWNQKWRGFYFVGGHRHDDESFRECLVRELQEKLTVDAEKDCLIGVNPKAHLDYIAWSQAAQAETHYTMELFDVQLRDNVLSQVAADSNNRWLAETEIRQGHCDSGEAVSPTMLLLLEKANLI